MKKKIIHYNTFPTTRFQGSKRRFLDWILYQIRNLEYKSVLDPFGGTGAVSWGFKKLKKKVYYNDLLKFNQIIGKALIENNGVKLDIEKAKRLMKKNNGGRNPYFIQKNFQGIYFLDSENKWLDIIRHNIQSMDNDYEKSIAYFALFQSCIIKRPFNLFHRRNLNFRTNQWGAVSFGNKVTWERPFDHYFLQFLNEANSAVFSNHKKNLSLNYDVLEIPDRYYADLIYLDPPYMNIRGRSPDYFKFYHFLEGLILPNQEWKRRINKSTKNLSMNSNQSIWRSEKKIVEAFENTIKKYQDSIIVLSYRDPGIPSIKSLKEIVGTYKSNVKVNRINHTYALSKSEILPKRNGQILIVGS